MVAALGARAPQRTVTCTDALKLASERAVAVTVTSPAAIPRTKPPMESTRAIVGFALVQITVVSPFERPVTTARKRTVSPTEIVAVCGVTEIPTIPVLGGNGS